MRRVRMVGRVLNRLLLFVAAVTVTAALVVWNPLRWFVSDDERVAEGPVSRDQTEIAVTSLERTVEADGVLQYTRSATAIAGGSEAGTITSIVEQGDTLSSGDVVFEVDGEPTVALFGEQPAWRSMTVDDVGADVAQLELALVELGYDPNGLLTTDETYTSYTAEVVSLWQADIGRPETGVAELGSVVFIDEAGLVTSTLAGVGDSVAGTSPTETVVVSASGRQLSFDVAPADVDTVNIGTEVSARLPDRTEISAVVTDLAVVAEGSQLATAVLEFEDDQDDEDDEDGQDDVVLPDGESIPVAVTWPVPIGTDVATVPAAALTRLDSGDYALEVVTGPDTTEFVPVTIGVTSGATVEVHTDLAPGTAIISP